MIGENFLKSNRIESLDSLRGIAAMIVVIFHCLLSYTAFYYANYDYEFNNWLMGIFTLSPLHTIWAGKEAVLLFFVLSGFVLMIPFANNRKPLYLPYLIKRICRIYIPYIVIMLVSVFIAVLFWEYNTLNDLSPTFANRWEHEVSLKSIIAYIAMFNIDTANVNGVVWTLFIEMKVSLYLPLFLLLIAKLEWKKGLIIALIINTGLHLGFGYANENVSFLPIKAFVAFFNESFYYNYFFILGAVLAKERNKLMAYSHVSGYAKVVLLLLSLVLINSRWISLITTMYLENIENFVTALGFALLFLVVLTSKTVDEFLTKKYLLYLGKISFSLYLVHIPVLMLTVVFLSKLIPTWAAFCLVPIFSVIVAHYSYKWIEDPAMKLGQRLSKLPLLQVTKKKKLKESVIKYQ